MGEATPTKIVSYALLFIGIALVIAVRLVPEMQGGLWSGIGLVLIGLSCLVDALFPGGSELTDEQIAMVRHMGLPYRRSILKVLSVVVGIALVAGGLALVPTSAWAQPSPERSAATERDYRATLARLGLE